MNVFNKIKELDTENFRRDTGISPKQFIICLVTLQILAVYLRKGRVHDFRMFKERRVFINSLIKFLADSGYQKIIKIHKNSAIPIKKGSTI
jgi:hypothetical protein